MGIGIIVIVGGLIALHKWSVLLGGKKAKR
jgi:hypothetical protein